VYALEQSETNEQEIVLFVESKDAAIPRSLPSGQYRIRALQLLSPFKYQTSGTSLPEDRQQSG
jgi:hypothetical protein